jgi:hypothetical protein
MSVAWPELIDAPRAIALPQSRRPSADCQPAVIIRQATSVDSADLKRAHPFLAGKKEYPASQDFESGPALYLLKRELLKVLAKSFVELLLMVPLTHCNLSTGLSLRTYLAPDLELCKFN